MMTRAEKSELYGKYAPLLFRRCNRFMRSQDEAQEAVASLFPKLLEEWEALRLEGSALRWIHQVTFKRCLAELKREKTWVLTDEAAWAEDARFEGVTEEGRAVIEALLDRRERPWEALTREIAMYAYWDGYSSCEIACLAGIPVNAVESRLEEARAWARQSLRPACAGGHASSAVLGFGGSLRAVV